MHATSRGTWSNLSGSVFWWRSLGMRLRLLFHERGKQTLCTLIFLVKEATKATHTHLDQTSHYSYELNFWHLWVLIMHGPYLKRTQLLCVICTVCEQPTLACHSLQLPCVHLTWVVFISGFLHTDAALALSESISVELDSEGSVVSTCTGTWILMRFSTCANLKCTCVP